MNNTTKKQAILQSLDSMSHNEMDKVLVYIKDLLYNPNYDRNYQEFKQNALSEIRNALNKERGHNLVV